MRVDAPTAALLAPAALSLTDVDRQRGRAALIGAINTEAPQLWLEADGTRRRLTDHGDAVSLGFFTPDGRHLLYGLDDGGDEYRQLHLVDLDSGGDRALTAAPQAVHEFGGFGPDGRTFAYAANTANGVDFDVYVRAVDGTAPRPVLRGQGQRTVQAWSPDGRALVVATAHGTLETELHLVDIATGAFRPLLESSPRVARNLAFLGPSEVLLATDAHREHVGVARLRLASGELDWRLATDADVEQVSLDPTGRRFAAVLNREGWDVIEVHELEGDGVPQRFVTQGVVHGLKWLDDGVLAGTLETSVQPLHPWRFELATGAAGPLGVGPAAVAGVWPELVHVPSFDGRWLPAFLYTPAAPAPAGGRPAVVTVHGGPEGQWRPGFHGDVQAMVARGWAVLAPNVRGSTGYGRLYASLDDRERRGDTIRDLAAVGRWLGARPDVDAGRLAVLGHSYGGFMTLASLSQHPELWRTGVDIFGFSDLQTMLRDTAPYRRNHRAREYGEDAALHAALSPLRAAGQIRAPLLVVHGLRDVRVPASESRQLIAALEARGHPVESRFVERAGHGFVRRADRLAVYGHVLDFLERTL